MSGAPAYSQSLDANGDQSNFVDRPVRDVTPSGVTPGPKVSGPLLRIPGVEPAPEQPRERNLFRVTVIDTATFEGFHRGRKFRVSLPGLLGLTFDQKCELPGGDAWPCGRHAVVSLRKYLRLSALRCTFVFHNAPDTLRQNCQIRGKDLSILLVRRGWVHVDDTADERLKRVLKLAKSSGAGIHRSPEDARNYRTLLESLSTTSGPLPPPPDLPIPDILAPYRDLEDTTIAPQTQ